MWKKQVAMPWSCILSLLLSLEKELELDLQKTKKLALEVHLPANERKLQIVYISHSMANNEVLHISQSVCSPRIV